MSSQKNWPAASISPSPAGQVLPVSDPVEAPFELHFTLNPAGQQPNRRLLRPTETGLSVLELRWGEGYLETEPYGHGKIARFYLAFSPSGDVSLPISAELGRPEHHEYRWVTFAEARQLLPSRFEPILEWAWGTVSMSG